MKTRIFVLALCATVLAGCDSGAEAGQAPAVSTAHKPDFAGVSFNMKKSDFEREGYLCKDSSKDGKTTTDCKNFDVRTSVFGQDVKGVFVGFLEGEDTPFRIGTEFPVEYENFVKRNALTMRIDEYYTSLPEQDMAMEMVSIRRWKRSDDAVLQLSAIKGIRGMIQSSITMIMFRPGDHSTDSK